MKDFKIKVKKWLCLIICGNFKGNLLKIFLLIYCLINELFCDEVVKSFNKNLIQPRSEDNYVIIHLKNSHGV